MSIDIETYPLQSLSLNEAQSLQFRIIDTVTRHFTGHEVLSLGDLGVVKGYNKPVYTKKVEKVFADVFNAQSALLVRGAGTGALRWALTSTLKANQTILLHDAPIYPTTKVTLETMGINIVFADFNDEAAITQAINENKDKINAVLVQHTRQKINDKYDFAKTVSYIKALLPNTPIITDDNYAALKVQKIGCQTGADLSSFSSFKILGPQGVGVILGKQEYIDKIEKYQYSGGSQVQGFEAMQALRGLIYAPVSLAISAQVSEELVQRLNNGEIESVKRAFIANAQSKVVLVELKKNYAKELLEITPEFGAAPHPVGSESIFEFAPMIYRVSGTFREQDPTLEKRMLRINPMRSGTDTIIRILKCSLEKVEARN